MVLVVPGFVGSGRSRRPDPFADALPDFFECLTSERGLRPASLRNYQHHLVRFEAYLARIGIAQLSELSLAILTAFVAERRDGAGEGNDPRRVRGAARVFALRASRGAHGTRSERRAGPRAVLPAVEHHVGRSRTSTRRR